ncbi:MAG: ornithine cyclodeaminase [Sphaerobacteraceae bacterium]|nr:MAG: ornithine cyclodeaminase [Sphaerobacteraceae bacterium]
MLALTAQDVQTLVPMKRAVELMKIVFSDLSAGKTTSPLRTPVPVPEADGVSLFMPAYVPSIEGLGMKVVSVFPRNREQNKPTINAIVAVLDASTGEPVALMDGTFLTALRTGAGAGAAADLLARKDSKVITCIGAGAQGLTQVWSVSEVRDIETVYIYDPDDSMRESFVDRLARYDSNLAKKVVPVTDLPAALRESDVVCTATTSKTPVYDHADIRPGTHINAVGAFQPTIQEIPVETLLNSYVVVDSVEAAIEEAGDLQIPINNGEISRDLISVEVGHLVDGTAKGRTSDDQITFFKSVGNAVQDIIVAKEAVSRAIETGRGQEFSL